MPPKKGNNSRQDVEEIPQVNSMTNAPVWLEAILRQQADFQQQQADFQREMLRMMSNQNVNTVNTESSTSTGNQSTTGTVRAARPEKLEVDITYSKFKAWRDSWNDYYKLQKLNSQPIDIQRADLRSCLTEEMKIHLKCAIDVVENDNSSVNEVLDKVENYLRQKRNVALDRVAFEERKQHDGEDFDTFYVSLRKLAEEGEICQNCVETRLVTRIMSGIADVEVRQKLLAITPFPSLKTTVEICRSHESARKDSEILNDKVPIEKVTGKRTPWEQNKCKPENCQRCGYSKHPNDKCPARNSSCHKCGGEGHWANMCRNKQASRNGNQKVKTFHIEGVKTVPKGKEPGLRDECSTMNGEQSELFETSALTEKIVNAAKGDNQYETLKVTIQKGFPKCKQQVNSEIMPFWNIRDDLSIEDNLITFGNRLLIPKLNNILSSEFLETPSIHHARKLNVNFLLLFWKVSSGIINILLIEASC